MFDRFAKEKLDFLRKKDKSRKGSIDKDAVRLANSINSKKDHYTTSSCAGRIVLLEMKSKRKDECRWIFKKHDKVNFNEIKKSLKNQKDKLKNQIWFKQQPLILHVACRNLDAANKLLEAARRIFRRAGIIGISENKITIEIMGSEHLETIVADKNFVVDDFYLKQLIKYANENFVENKKKIKKLEKFMEVCNF